jgi:hypothetical protein
MLPLLYRGMVKELYLVQRECGDSSGGAIGVTAAEVQVSWMQRKCGDCSGSASLLGATEVRFTHP